MFCVKCGCKIDDNTNFCPKCGLPTQSNNAVINHKESVSNELDRKAVIIHLNDVLALECMKRHLEGKLRQVSNKRTWIKS
ncbi:MAG: zinc ribbon domain-containing protein [Oscillospiraceae bacterium]